MKLFKSYIVVFISNISFAYAQSIYPVYTDQVYCGYVFTNPSAIRDTNNIDAFIANKNYFGLFQNIGVQYASLQFKIGKKRTNSINHGGFLIQREYDGEFLNRTRAYGRFAIEKKLSKQTSLSIGTSLGCFNYHIKSSNTNVGASTWLPDGNIGIWIKTEKLNAGIAKNQFLKSKDEVFIRSYTLNGFYIANLDYTININHELSASIGNILRLYNDIDSQVDVFGIIKYKNILSFGSSFKINRGITYLFSIDKIIIQDKKISILTSFNSALGKNSGYNSNQVELCLRYYH